AERAGALYSRTLEASLADDTDRPAHGRLSAAGGGRDYRVGILCAPHPADHVQDRRERGVLARRRRRPLRELGGRIAPAPRRQAAPGNAGEATSLCRPG